MMSMVIEQPITGNAGEYTGAGNTDIDPTSMVKVLEQTVFAGTDWNDPANDNLAGILSFTDDLRDLVEHVDYVRREYAQILAMYVQERAKAAQKGAML